MESPSISNESPALPDSKESKPLPKRWSIPDLLRLPATGYSWIIEGLLRPGNQVLLAGPPKGGKSLLASEIAISLTKPFAEGEERFLFQPKPPEESGAPGLKILKISPPKPEKGQPRSSWKVLFISLEMRAPEIADRIQKQLSGLGVTAKKLAEEEPAPESLNIPLVHVFGLATADPETLVQDLRILTVTAADYGKPPVTEPGADHKKLHDLVNEVRPDVVIYDTLIQMHDVNENDNILMKKVMRSLREISTIKTSTGTEEIAHIVVHHTRKESGQFRAPLSPEIMRGAGSIHGTADLVMLARPDLRSGALEIHISSRSSSIPNFYLIRNPSTLTHQLDAPKAKKDEPLPKQKQRIVHRVIVELLTHEFGELGHATINQALAEDDEGGPLEFTVGKATIRDRITELIEQGTVEMDDPESAVNIDLRKFRLTQGRRETEK